jgi:hypothetical protein
MDRLDVPRKLGVCAVERKRTPALQWDQSWMDELEFFELSLRDSPWKYIHIL